MLVLRKSVTRSPFAWTDAAHVTLSRMTTTSGPRRADIDSFFTCRNPHQFQIDWRTFYESAERRTDAVRERWSNKLDVAYGSNAKQRLDVYFPRQTVERAPIVLFLHGGGFREGDPGSGF